jgi:MFS transporter, FHS family, L-fucose permease
MASIGGPVQSKPSNPASGNGQTFRGPFAIMTILFFMWGFMTVWNDILIPRFKDAFDLDYFRAMLVQLAFFGAYAVGSLIYYIVSLVSGDPINRIGYKNGVIIGLLIAATGSALFYPAAQLCSVTITAVDLKDAPAFAAKLKQPADPVSTYIAGRLSAANRQALAAWPGTGELGQALQNGVAEDLNKIVVESTIWDEGRFSQVKTRPETLELVKKNPQEGGKLSRLNRLLLEDAYPELAKNKQQVAYPSFLIALFIVGLGFAMLQIAANPYVTILGPERTASSRLNLSQAFNSFGTTIGPIIGGYLIFQVFNRGAVHGADAVKIPYLCFAGVFVLLAVFFKFAHLPSFTNTEQITHGAGALKHPHTVLGMLAIFMYVGGEVTVGSAIVNFLGTPKLGGLTPEVAAPFLAFYWGGLMIGRFMGSFALSDMRGWLKNLMVVLVPVVAFGVVSFKASAGDAQHYGLLLVVLLVAFFLGKASPQRMLALFSCLIIGLLITGMTSTGDTAKWAILGVGLFCSVMWSNIFSLAIEGLGALKSQASSLLVMAILGGAILPPLQGKIADLSKDIQFSFIVPVIAFAYVAFYGLYGYRAGRSKG